MLLIKKGTIVTSENVFVGDVLIDGEKIVEVGNTIKKKNVKTINAKGKYVLPGGIDSSVHISQKKGPFACKDSFKEGTLEAALGGTTTILNYVFPIRGSYKKAINENKENAENNAAVDYSFHLAITNYSERGLNELENIMSMGITSFICYYTGSGMFLSFGELYSIFNGIKKCGGIVGVYIGNGSLLEKRSKEAIKKGLKGIEHFLYSYPEDVEGFLAYSILSLAKMVDIPIFLINVSTRNSLEKIKLFKDIGLNAYSDVPIHYLIFDSKKYEEKDFLKFVALPPLRNESQSQYLWNNLKTSKIDFISSDHIFVDENEQKKILESSPQKLFGGIPGVRNRLEIFFSEGVKKRGIPITEMVKLTSTNIAKTFGLFPQKGTISPNSDADIVILDPEKEWSFEKSKTYPGSPYENFKVTGKIEKVILRGEIIVEDGKYVSGKLSGKFISRHI